MGNSLSELLPKNALDSLVASVVSEGDVYRMKLDSREGIVGKNSGDISRNKYFVVIGHDVDGNAIGFFVVNTTINPYINEERKRCHLKIDSQKYEFLEGVDRYVDCSALKTISKERFAELFASDKLKSKIDEFDLSAIKSTASSYRNADMGLLKRFGIVK